MELPDSCKCTICGEFYEENDRVPRTLHCGHTCCHQCMSNVFNTNNNKRDRVKCPICRKTTPVKRENIESISKNFTILEIIKNLNEPARKRQRMDSNNSDSNEPLEPIQSGPQCVENPGHLATVNCNKCREPFCEDCFEKFHKGKVLSSHKKLPLADGIPLQFPMCSKHQQNRIMWLCVDDLCQKKFEKNICDICRYEDHSGHTVENLDEQLSQHKSKIVSLSSTVEAKLTKFDEEIKHLRKNSLAHRVNGIEAIHRKSAIISLYERSKTNAIAGFENFLKEEKKTIDAKIYTFSEERRTHEKLLTELKLAESSVNLGFCKDVVSEAEAVAERPIADIKFVARKFKLPVSGGDEI